MADSTSETAKAVFSGLASTSELRTQIEDNAQILFAPKLHDGGIFHISIAAEKTEHRSGRFRAILSLEPLSYHRPEKQRFLAMSAWTDSGDAALQALLSQLAVELNQRLGSALSELPNEEQCNGAEGITRDRESLRASVHDYGDDICDGCDGIHPPEDLLSPDDYQSYLDSLDDCKDEIDDLIQRINKLDRMMMDSDPNGRRDRRPGRRPGRFWEILKVRC